MVKKDSCKINFINPVQESEIEKLINSSNQNKSLSPCSISVKVLKNHADVLKQPLAYLINFSFQQGLFPDALKTARVTPIFKKEDPQLFSSYSLISVMPVSSKLYEKRMYSRLYAFLINYKLLFKKQFGFRNNSSTSHALHSLTDLIKKYLDNDCFPSQSIGHCQPWNSPPFYGILELTNSWLRSFLENRKQYISLPGHSSSAKTVTCGVPQGSTLGPLLFLLYINSLQGVLSKSLVHHFASDTNLLFPAKKLCTIESIVNHELTLLVQWLRSKKISINKTKTELIIFRSRLPYEPDIRINKWQNK